MYPQLRTRNVGKVDQVGKKSPGKRSVASRWRTKETYFSSATFDNSNGLIGGQRHTFTEIKLAYCRSKLSTDVRTTGNVMASCLREEQNASTVLRALKI